MAEKIPVVPTTVPIDPIDVLSEINDPCDVPGCGARAVKKTDGTEKDAHHERLGQPLRPAVPRLFVCGHHHNWPHSDDAKVFALTNGPYKSRK